MTPRSIRADIIRQQDFYNISDLELAATARMSERTFRRRMQDPTSFSLGELMRIASKLHMTLSLGKEGIE